MYRMSHINFDVRGSDKVIELHMFGGVTFLALPKLTEALEGLPSGKEVHILFDDMTFIDHACIDLINSFETMYEEGGGTVVIEWDSLMTHYRTSGRLPTSEVA